ncbi:ABC transporter permease [Tessaracoccus sp. OS52]|uniref:ABC transporter permease n=1 Tax=Tessaracoccus sp. OS52 TaxID=2886691 RepID=UPI001D113581|nr:ABC transporter permease [Tessaracoccus sp. OS52]MCC2593981.1 ABC transporter permease [Tessaracoccus sp. OS52]
MTTTTTPAKQGIGARLASVTRLDPHITRLVVILLALLVIFAVLRPRNFANDATWISMAVQFPEFGLMALGVMLCMITGGIDLSVVGIANMTSIVAASVMLALAPGGSATAIIAAMAASLVLGALAGLLNGFLVAKVKIPAILATLGTLELFTGIAIVITAGSPISGLPPEYSAFMAARLFGVIPMQFVVFVVAVVIIGLVMSRTTFGSKIYMLGTNATSAKFSGLNSTWLLLRTYMFSGVLASMAGLVMLANYNSAKADYGVVYTLLTVLIVVLGGVNPNGGSGRLFGVVLAIVTLQILSSGLNLFPQISNFYRDLIWGGVLLLVIATSGLNGRNRFRWFKRNKEVSSK